jgi:uncharacterized repeat protein (TIGR01451 family)
MKGRSSISKPQRCKRWGKPWHGFRLIALASLLVLLQSGWAAADLSAPAWYDPDGVGSGQDWHYRVPLNIPAGAAVNHTIRVDVDFNLLLAQLGASGTFDGNSPRVVRNTGQLAAVQQYTDAVFGGATDLANNGRGEIRFILEDDGPVTYYLYFDITSLGVKSPWNVNNTINGNFEFVSADRQNPPGWNGSALSGYQAAVIDNQTVTVSSNDGWPAQVTTAEDANTGNHCYLLGERDGDESSSGAQPRQSATLSRTISLPASNRGVLRIRYRVKGWDGSDNGQSVYDFLRIQIRRTNGHVLQELVGPAGPAYASMPFSPNRGTGQGSSGHPGYGPYNGGITGVADTGPAPWHEATYDLSSTNRTQIELYIETSNYYQFKSWFHIDDVQWSVVDAALGNPQAFGVNIVAPHDTATGPATVYHSGETLVIRAQLDARPASVTANLLGPGGTPVQSNISLFNDGTHGDAVAGDAFWTNDGSIPAQATYGFLATDPSGSNWQVVVSAADGGSTAADAQVFTLISPPNILLLKSVATYSDPVHGTSLPKAIPGAFMTYTVTAGNHGGSGTDSDSVVVVDRVPANTTFYVGDLGQPWGPVAFSDGPPLSGLSFNPATDLAFSMDGGNNFNLTAADLISDANGCDPRITHIRVNPKGVFNGVSSGNAPEFTLQFRVRVQ